MATDAFLQESRKSSIRGRQRWFFVFRESMTSSNSPGTDFVESGHQQNQDYVCMNAYDCILVVCLFMYVLSIY